MFFRDREMRGPAGVELAPRQDEAEREAGVVADPAKGGSLRVGEYEPSRACGQPKAITGPRILPATSACCQLTVLARSLFAHCLRRAPSLEA